MTIESEKNNVVTNFLLEVTQAENFQELSKAFKRINTDFDEIINKDTNCKLGVFIKRYQELALEAESLLGSEHNGNRPSEQQNALFGEMIILRDFCLKRLECNE